MTPEIKTRIDQIRRGELPEGYRKTLWGIAPTSWGKSCVSEICTITSGSTPRRNNSDSFKGSILWVTSGELKAKYLIDTFEKITEDAAKSSNLYMYEPGTVVIALYGLEAAGVRGTASIIGRKCTISQACMAFTRFSNVLNEYFYYWYVNNGQVIGLSYAQGTKQQNLSTEIVGALPVDFPDIDEQEKIIEILSLQDKIIELKENILAEKQRQKEYLMQQLLTGKKRLPGFNAKWEFLRAKDIFRNIANKNHDGSLEVLSATQDQGVIPRSQVDIDIKYDRASLSGYKKVEAGNFVISLRSFQGGIEYSEYTGIVSPAYTVLAPCIPIANMYYKQFFKSADYISRLNTAVYGIRDGKQISYDDFGRIKIPYPPIEEQQAIAQVLTTADHEIELLQKDIDQERQKKKALMQLLLTGIVRVNT